MLLKGEIKLAWENDSQDSKNYVTFIYVNRFISSIGISGNNSSSGGNLVVKD